MTFTHTHTHTHAYCEHRRTVHKYIYMLRIRNIVIAAADAVACWSGGRGTVCGGVLA